MRTCSVCGKKMLKGYVVGGGDEYYCSKECLHKVYSEEECEELFEGADTDDNEENYYTDWIGDDYVYKIVLTERGKQAIAAYIAELKAKRKEILDAGKDTADDTELPDINDILSDIMNWEDADKEYYNGWPVTDNYDADSMLCLERDVHYVIVDMEEEEQ